MTTLDASEFREAMASFPSGVVVATTVDAAGRSWGFTASAFCSVSIEPPLVLLCLAKSADCHRAFTQAGHCAISVLHSGHRELAMRFATKGADKFAGYDFAANAHGVPVLSGAHVGLDCTPHAVYDVGDHSVLIARVQGVVTAGVPRAGRSPIVYYQREFHPIAAACRRPSRGSC